MPYRFRFYLLCFFVLNLVHIAPATAKRLTGWGEFRFGIYKYDLADIHDLTFSKNSDGTINVLGYHAGNYDPSIFLLFSKGDSNISDIEGTLTQIEVDYDVAASCEDVREKYVDHLKEEVPDASVLRQNSQVIIIANYDPGFQETLLQPKTSSVCSVSLTFNKVYVPRAARHTAYDLTQATDFVVPTNRPTQEQRDAKAKEDADDRAQSELIERLVVLFSEYQVAARCAAANVIFTKPQIAAIKNEIAVQLDKGKVRQDTKDKAWDFASTAIAAQTIHNTDCTEARSQLGYQLPPNVFAVDNPNPF